MTLVYDSGIQGKRETHDLGKFQDSFMKFLQSSLTQMLMVHIR